MSDMIKKKLANLFGDYRAEWVQKQFGSLFVRPPYYDQLESIRPCFLVGGRGTGKTVSLKSLRYDAVQLRTSDSETQDDNLPYLGVYIRINKNRVRAFSGDVLRNEQWTRIFAHYFNLLILQELAQLSQWLTLKTDRDLLPHDDLRWICSTLGTHACVNLHDLKEYVTDSIAILELYVNNPTKVDQPILSIAEAPVRAFIEVISKNDGYNRPIFICVDEYENLLDYQQAVVNTYIKHSEAPLSYKLGVRKFGLRNRNTIDSADLMRSPEDYSEIELYGDAFISFCKDVVQHRLERAKADGLPVPGEVNDLLPGLSREEEAVRLGAQNLALEVLETVRDHGEPGLVAWVESLTTADQYFLHYWTEGQGEDLIQFSEQVKDNAEKWNNLINNHGYISLFSLSKGRKGVRIRKFYAGEDTFLSLASGNIRYYLELIDESIKCHFEGEQLDAEDNVLTVDPEVQTVAAQRVGKRRLDQLEGLSLRGVELKRLVLAIGKVFFEYARAGPGHAPEISTFVLSGPQEAKDTLMPLLQEGVSHLALEVMPRTKATSDFELKDEEFRLHPIFAPFFEYSHRKKRRIHLDASSLLKVQKEPVKAIQEILKGRIEQTVEPSQLPKQLVMFNSFYRGS